MRRASFHHYPEQENALYKIEKDNWKEVCGFNSPPHHKFNKSKSEGHFDLNAIQLIDRSQLSLKSQPKVKSIGSSKVSNEKKITTKAQPKKLHLPAIDEKHNTYHSSKSPVILRKSRFKQVQEQGCKAQPILAPHLQFGEYM